MLLPSTVSTAGLRQAIKRATSRTGLRRPSPVAAAAMERIGDFLGDHAGENFTLNELARMASMRLALLPLVP